MTKRTASFLLLPLLLVLAAGCTAEKQEGGGEEMPLAVEVAPVRVDTLEKILTAVGTLSSPQATLVTSQIDGKVTQLDIRQGGTVDAGALLATLDDSVQQAEVAAAEAAVYSARQVYERDRKIKGTGGISELQLQTEKADLRQAEARLAQARASLGHTNIRAPYAGVLGLRKVSLGSYLKAGDAVVDIRQIDPLHLDFSIPQQEVAQPAVGQRVSFTVSGLAGDFQGQVTTVDPALAVDSRSVPLQATVPNPDRRLETGDVRPGAADGGGNPDALFVPMQALVPEGQVNHVWVVGADERAEQRTVTVGAYRENWVQILSGLQADDRVIAAGTQKLRPKAKLKIAPFEPVHNPRLDLTREHRQP